MKPVVFHEDAEKELAESARWCEDKRSGLGRIFVRAVEDALDYIRQHPRTGTPQSPSPIRGHSARRFPFTIFYADLPERIWILAVAHGRRRPGYWKARWRV